MTNATHNRFFALDAGMLLSGIIHLILLVLLAVGLAGCGGGAETSENPATSNVAASSYTGPAPATSDVQAFRLNLWENLKADNRCGACHVEGVQAPEFVRQDDVNLAYAAANTIVDLAQPSNSRMVTKVAGGHNCWLSAPSACASVITAFIEAWAGNTAAGAARQIQLTAPPIKDPGATLNFPASSAGFAATVWPVLTANCAGCHTDTSATPQAPFFAGSDADAAYEAAKSKMDLDNPANSRLVVRLRNEFHNCWTDCASDATAMEAQIAAFAGTITPTTVDPDLVISKALNITDGVVASGGSRYEANVIALWEFKTGSGTTAFDTSGVEPGLHLSFSGDVSWVGGWGIQIGANGKAQGSTTASKKLHDLITATGEYSIEAWVAPANVTQEGPARIVSYSAGTRARNFTLGQTQYNYDFLHRSSTTDANGEPALSTADADEDLQATLQHVVVTYDPVNGRRIYVNGVFTDDVDPVAGGGLADWDDSFAFVLGNEVSNDRPWMGTIRMVAIHNRALTQAQIRQNFDVGVGEKFFLLFSVSDLIPVPQSYIMFEVSQFDSYSYLFNKPTFISLDANAVPNSIPLKAMRIGINGREAVVGQAYRNLDVTLDSSRYSTSAGQPLSDLGTIIALENGPASDEFFLSFEVLGSNTNVVTEPAPPPLPAPTPLPAVSDIGLRTFDEINASMAALTGVDPLTVKASYDTLRQQLPAVETIEGFLSAHQMAIAQLSIEYCSALVEDAALRSSFFGAFGFDSDVVTAFGSGDSAGKNQVVNALFDNMVGLPGSGTDLSNAPSRLELKTELIGYDLGGTLVNTGNLFDRLAGSCSGPADPACQSDRTRAIVKAMCGSTLGSAAMLLQ